MNDHFFVYLHERIDTNTIFYVGKGTISRINKKTNRSTYWHNIVNKAGGFRSHIFASNMFEKEALELEIALIKTLREVGVPICNLTNGGDGISGYKFTEEQIKRLSESKKGRASTRKGIPFTEEHKEKLRKAKLGKKQTEEHKRNSSNARIGLPVSEATRRKISDSLKGKKIAKEVLARKFKAVLCVTTGVHYESVTAASLDLNIPTSNISRCCKGTFKKVGGFVFKYITNEEQ